MAKTFSDAAYRQGYEEGYDRGYARGQRDVLIPKGVVLGRPEPRGLARKKRRKTKSLLSELAGKKWKTYKRKHPHGQKTYIQIRAEVSRSRAYKKRKG